MARAFVAIGAGAGADAAGALPAGARDEGVIGAPVCAQTGAAIARTAAIATPLKRCFMPLSSVAVPDGTVRCKGLAQPESGPSQAPGENDHAVVPFREYTTLSVAYPTLASIRII